VFQQLKRDRRRYTVLESPTYLLGLVGDTSYDRAVILKGDRILAQLREGEWSSG